MGIVDKVFLMLVFMWCILIVADIVYRRIGASDEVVFIHLLPAVLLIFFLLLSLQSGNLLYIAFGAVMFALQFILASKEEKPDVDKRR